MHYSVPICTGTCNYFLHYSNNTPLQGNRMAPSYLAFHLARYSNHSNNKKGIRFTKECGLHLSAGRSRWWIRALQCCCSSWSPERDSTFTKPGWETPPFFMFWHLCWPKQGSSARSWGPFGTGCWSNTLFMARGSRCSTFCLGRTGCIVSADGFSWKGHHWVYWALARLLYFLKKALNRHVMLNELSLKFGTRKTRKFELNP